MSTGGGGTESGGGSDSTGKPPSSPPNTSVSGDAKDSPTTSDKNETDESSVPGTANEGNRTSDSPPPQSQSHQQSAAFHQQINHQQQGTYFPYPPHQMTPEPPSPTTNPSGYDLAAFMQQAALQQAAAAAGNHFAASPQYTGGIPHPPLSPLQPNNASTSISMGIVPPASPLFPGTAASGAFPGSAMDPQHAESSAMSRISNTGSAAAPPSPSLPYLTSPPLGPSSTAPGVSTLSGVYQYGGANPVYGNHGGRGSSQNSPEQTWPERSSQQQTQIYPQTTSSPSPQLQPQGVPVQYQTGLGRAKAYSFDGSEMLPPSAVDQDRSPPTYAHYPGSQPSSVGAGAGGSVFAQQPWGYSNSADAYHGSHASAQQRSHHTGHHQQHQLHLGTGHLGGAGHHLPRHLGHPGPGQPGGVPYYTATTPGPPIQTTASNKGPDGANLFIFHIPNHFTNLDMYHLFCHYGTLLSVRIMVEKDTGRSRGFGFVSYDSPEAAAMAIKELNGFVIGNKRLKVQHKQIRATDHSQQAQPPAPPYSISSNEGGFRHTDAHVPSSSSTPSGIPPTLSASQWYDAGNPPDERSEDRKEIQGVSSINAKGEIGQVTVDAKEDLSVLSSNMNAAREVPEKKTLGIPSPPLTGESVDNSGKKVSGAPVGSPLASLDPIRDALPDVSEQGN